MPGFRGALVGAVISCGASDLIATFCSGFHRPLNIVCESPQTSAADLKFLHHSPQVRLRNFKSKSGTRIIRLLVPGFSKFVREGAAMYHELRKPEH